MAFNPNFGATIQAVFQDPGLYQQVAQKTYLPEALKSLWNMNATLQDAVQKNRIANEMEEENPDFDKIAAMDARRINNQDPTSIWRWKAAQDQAADLHGDTLFAQQQQREADLERIEAEKAKQKEEQDQYLRNKISSTLPTMQIGWSTSPEQVQQFKNTLAGLKAEAMNRQLPLDQINKVEAQLNEQLPMQQARIAMDNMANAKDLFNITKEEKGFGKDAKAYHDYLLQQYTAITSRYPEAKYDPEFNKVFKEADKLHRKKVLTPKVKAPGRK